MPDVHSNLVGGSSADRVLNCPASIRTLLRLPAVEIPIESEYAADGTACHKAMELLLSDEGMTLAPSDLIGRTCYDRVITEEHVETFLQPAWEALFEVLDDEIIEELHSELLVSFPWLPGCFGTLDVAICTPRRLILCDFKFGQILVRALYPDPVAGDMVNAQLQFYAAALLKTMPQLARGRKIELCVIQPAAVPVLDRVVVSRHELHVFRRALVDAVVEAFGPNPARRRGEWCRFAECKSICSLWTGPVLSFARRPPQKPGTITPPTEVVTPYGRYLSEGLVLAEMVEPMLKTLREQAHAFMEAGGLVPGHKLVNKRPQRKWRDGPRSTDPELIKSEKRKIVSLQLSQLGFDPEEVWAPQELRSPAQVEKFAKKKGIEVPADLQPSLSSGTTIALNSDGRPAATVGTLIETFRASLKLVQGGRG